MKVLLTGASGFVGKNLLLGLPSDWDVTAIYFNSNDFEKFISEKRINVTSLRCDLGDVLQTSQLLGNKEFDVCIHLAANGNPRKSVDQPLLDLRLNTLSTLSIIESGAKINRFIYFSSGAVYEGLTGDVNPQSAIQPHTPYSVDKWASEQHIKNYQEQGRINDYIIVRFFGCYGPFEPERKIYHKLVTQFAIDKTPDITLYGNGQNKIYAMYVTDMVEGVIKMIQSKDANVTVDFCGEEHTTIEELTRIVANVFDITPNISFTDVGAVEQHSFNLSCDSMYDMFNFKPKTPLKKGLYLYGEHLK